MIVKLIKGYAYGDGVVFVKKDNPIIEVADDGITPARAGTT